MNTDTASLFFKKLEKDIFSFIYQGEFNDENIGEILRLNDYSIDYVSELSKLKGRISFLMAECFQNIARHVDKPEILNNTNNKPSMFITRNSGDNYYIGSSNLIDNKKIASLKVQLENINNLNTEELGILHKDLLSSNDFSEKGGVGLGLIEMSRKSGHKLEFHFDFVNYYLSQFYVQLNLRTKKEIVIENRISLSDTISLHQLMISNQVLMVHKGDFNQESVLPLLKMLETNLAKQSEPLQLQKKVFYLVMEVLQNVSKYGALLNGVKEGIFLFCRKGHQYVVSTGNFIENIKIPVMEAHLNEISLLDKDRLEAFHKKKLLEGAGTKINHGGLGLIDVARYTSEKIQYSFKPVDDNISFYTLNITI